MLFAITNSNNLSTIEVKTDGRVVKHFCHISLLENRDYIRRALRMTGPLWDKADARRVLILCLT